MASVDLTVRGGGAFGLCIAWEAARRGARVRLIETVQIGAGSSGGIVGALSPHVPENWNPKKNPSCFRQMEEKKLVNSRRSTDDSSSK